MSSRFGTVLLGRELEWLPMGDTPGTWAYSLDNQTIAVFWWSPADREVRAEVGTALWRVPFQGVFLLRSSVIDTDVKVPRLLFAGGLRKGLMEIPNGPRLILFSQLDRDIGPWMGIDDERGNGILRIRSRIGKGRIWSAVKVTPERRFANLIEPLLVLWGGISILRQKVPFLSVTTLAASEAAVQRAIERMLGSGVD